MLQDHRIFCWQKNRGGFGLIYYVSNSTNLRELLGGVCLSGICLEICLVEKKIIIIMVSRNLLQAHLLEVGLTRNLIHSPPCRLHVDISSMKSSLDLQAFTLVCEVNLDGLRPFDQ